MNDVNKLNYVKKNKKLFKTLLKKFLFIFYKSQKGDNFFMNINPISFTGIKNIGYAKISSDIPELHVSRNIMNMELTNDKEHKDLAEYKKIVQKFPILRNKFNENFINVELTSIKNDNDLTFVPRLNGVAIPASQETNPIINFMQNLISRITRLKTSDMKTDPKYINSYTAYKGLVYNEELDNFISGISGEFDILKGTGVTEHFADHFLKEGDTITKQEAEYFTDTVQGVTEILHNPQYVHNGSIYLEALLKGYKNLINDNSFS